MILSVHNLGSLAPLIMVMGLEVEQEDRQLREGKHVSDSPLWPPYLTAL